MFKQLDKISRAVLDSVSAHIAILDKIGVILDANQAWKKYEAKNSEAGSPSSIGLNYLTICEAVTGPEAEQAALAATGIRAVLEGRLAEFAFEYPCHGPNKRQWFNMRVNRLVAGDPGRLVVSHENITNVKLAEEKIIEREAELEEKNQLLQDANAALRAILKQRDEDKVQLEENVTARVHNLIFPYLERLEEGGSPEMNSLLQLVRYNLEDIVSPFARKLTSRHLNLTPMEIKVANLVKHGRDSKEIANLLFISFRTVNFHRENLRRKLGLHKTGANLRTHLMTMD